jgi:hypothetical protein
MKRAAAIAIVLACLAGVAVVADQFRSAYEPAVNANVEYDGRLTFLRVRYNPGHPGYYRARGSYGEPPWMHDYPTADTHLMKILKELTLADPRTDGSALLMLDDPGLMDYPIAYMSEPGYWTLSDEEAKNLRTYLLKGGLIIFDDFRDDHWYNLEEQMKRVLPDARWITLDEKATVFNSFFEIRNFNFGYYGKETYFGIFENNDPNGRLMAVGGHNQDLGEFWEFSDTGMMPVDISNEAYKFGVNYFIYGLIH